MTNQREEIKMAEQMFGEKVRAAIRKRGTHPDLIDGLDDFIAGMEGLDPPESAADIFLKVLHSAYCLPDYNDRIHLADPVYRIARRQRKSEVVVQMAKQIGGSIEKAISFDGVPAFEVSPDFFDAVVQIACEAINDEVDTACVMRWADGCHRRHIDPALLVGSWQEFKLVYEISKEIETTT